MNSATIRRATEADEPTVVSLWNEASGWLRSIGSDQWQYPIKMHNVRRAIRERTCWIVENDDGEPVATVTLDDHADPQLWLPEDDPEQALYLHRLVVRLDQRGHQLGTAILDWASLRASQAGKLWLRLDAWTSNAHLHQYYLKRGFELIRVLPHTQYGALFQRAAGVTRERRSYMKEN